MLTEEYSEPGVHVANVVIDGLIDSPSTRALPRAQQHPEVVMDPVKIARQVLLDARASIDTVCDQAELLERHGGHPGMEQCV